MKERFRKKGISFLLISILVLTGILPAGTVYAKEDKTDIYSLKISYYMEDTSKAIASSYEATLPKGESYSVSSPVIEGYSLKDQTQATVSGTLENDTQINVFYTYTEQDAAYTVNYIGRSIDGTKETTLDTVQGTAEIGSVINAEDKEFEGYVREPADLSLNITADGKAEKNLYYTVKTNPCIIFNADGYEIPIISEKPGTDISEQMESIEEPQRKGYLFAGWDKEFPSKMPDEDFIINAVWEPGESSYTVLHWFQNIENDEYSLEGEVETRKALTGSEVTATQEDIALGETTDSANQYYGFDYSHADTVTVDADGNSVLNIYYDREIWTINIYDTPLNEDMRYDDYVSLERKLWKSVSGKYGSSTAGKMPSLNEIENRFKESPFPPEVTEEGQKPYHYINLLIADQSNRFEESPSLPYKDTFFTADTFTIEGIENTHVVDIFPYYSKQEQRTFHISVFGQSLNDPEQYELILQQAKVGKANTPTNLTLPPVEGFTNENGFYRIDNEPVENLEWVSNETWDGRVVARYEDGSYKFQVLDWNEFRQQRVKNTVTFQSGDDIIETVEDVYYETPLDEYLENIVPKNGEEYMKFAGWYENPDLMNIRDPVTKETMPPNDLTFYAKWVPVDYTVTFDTRGGSEVEAQTVTRGTCAVLPEEPTRENYTFAGWYTSEGDRWNFDKQITGDITLYGLWKPITAEKGYKIRHILQPDNSTIAEYTGKGLVGDTFAAQALNAQDKDYVEGSYIIPDALTKSIILTKNGTNEAVFYYNMPDLKDYTVSYLLEGTETKLREDKTVTDTTLSRVTELAEKISGYLPKQEYLISDLSAEGENKIVFYYTRESANLTVSKTVTGKMGDTRKDFTMEVTLQKTDKTPVSGSFPVSGAGYEEGAGLTFDSDGKAEIALKDGESVTISELERGGSFQVKEVSVPSGYEVTYNGQTSDSGIQGTLEAETKVSVVNRCDEIPVTDLDDHEKSGYLLAFSAGALLLASGFVLVYRRRKQRG